MWASKSASHDLEIVAARVRPGKVSVLGRLVIEDFASRPAGDWGADYARFLRSAGIARLSATVLLPRRDVIVRHLSLPGVAARDIESAIRFQIDTLHPYGDEDVAWGWSPLGWGAVLVGIVRRATVERYNKLFVEAGIAVAGFTFSAAAVHAAIRLGRPGPPAHGFVALSRTEARRGRSLRRKPGPPPLQRRVSVSAGAGRRLALSELRLPPATGPSAWKPSCPNRR